MAPCFPATVHWPQPGQPELTRPARLPATTLPACPTVNVISALSCLPSQGSQGTPREGGGRARAAGQPGACGACAGHGAVAERALLTECSVLAALPWPCGKQCFPRTRLWRRS